MPASKSVLDGLRGKSVSASEASADSARQAARRSQEEWPRSTPRMNDVLTARAACARPRAPPTRLPPARCQASQIARRSSAWRPPCSDGRHCVTVPAARGAASGDVSSRARGGVVRGRASGRRPAGERPCGLPVHSPDPAPADRGARGAGRGALFRAAAVSSGVEAGRRVLNNFGPRRWCASALATPSTPRGRGGRTSVGVAVAEAGKGEGGGRATAAGAEGARRGRSWPRR